MEKITQTYSNKLENLYDVKIEIHENPFNFDVRDLVDFAIRNNDKRKFLFVSKLIGKHIPINPNIIQITAFLLAGIFFEETIPSSEAILPTDESLTGDDNPELEIFQRAQYTLKKTEKINYIANLLKNKPCSDLHTLAIEKYTLFEKTLVIGFAETATGIAHAFYSALNGPSGFIHTTRDRIDNAINILDFQEEHTHSTTHFCYPLQNDFIESFDRIVLVDDEITTGKTALNFIKVLNKICPNKKYSVVSILDWRSEKWKAEYASLSLSLGIELNTHALIKGTCDFQSFNPYTIESSLAMPNIETAFETVYLPSDLNIQRDLNCNNFPHDYLFSTGRFGLTNSIEEHFENFLISCAEKLKKFVTSKPALFLGMEEFIYIPAILSSKLGTVNAFQSTTQSPIIPIDIPDYGIRSCIKLINPYNPKIPNYLYNCSPKQYDSVFYFFERDFEYEYKEFIAERFSQIGVKKIYFIVFSNQENYHE